MGSRTVVHTRRGAFAAALVLASWTGCTQSQPSQAGEREFAVTTTQATTVTGPVCGTGAHDTHDMSLKLECSVCHVCGGAYGFDPTYTLQLSGQTLAGGTITRGSTPGSATCSVACHGIGQANPAPVSWTPTGTPFACTECHVGQSAATAQSAHYPVVADPVASRNACQVCHSLADHLSQIAIYGGDGSVVVVDPRDPASVGSSCTTCHGGNGRLLGGATPPWVVGYGAGGGDLHGASAGTGFGGTLLAPYARGQAALACTACHDGHVSGSSFLIGSSVNGSAVSPAVLSRAGVGGEALCQKCHSGNRHAGCMTSGCHSIDPVPAGKPCFFCHGHEGIVNFTLPSWDFHPDTSKPQEFCDHCHVPLDNPGQHWFPQTVETVPPVVVNDQVQVQFVGSDAKIVWATNEPATSYVEWGTDAPTHVTGSFAVTTSHEVRLTGLTPQATYQYRVRTSDPFRNVTVSSIRSFVAPQPGAPTTPALTPNRVIPAYSDPVQVTFAWSASTSPLGKPLQYRIQIATATTFATTVIDATTSQTSYAAMLPTDTQYYWRVLATDGTLSSPWSAVESTFIYWDW